MQTSIQLRLHNHTNKHAAFSGLFCCFCFASFSSPSYTHTHTHVHAPLLAAWSLVMVPNSQDGAISDTCVCVCLCLSGCAKEKERGLNGVGGCGFGNVLVSCFPSFLFWCFCLAGKVVVDHAGWMRMVENSVLVVDYSLCCFGHFGLQRPSKTGCCARKKARCEQEVNKVRK